MNVLAHLPLFGFAFTLLVCMAAIWWFLRERREGAGREEWTSSGGEDERSIMEILQDPVPPAQHEAASDLSVSLDQNEVDQQILRREETETRLAVLDDLIGAQRSRIASARTTGLDVTFLEEKLKVLSDSREEYRSALKRLLADFADGKDGNGRVP